MRHGCRFVVDVDALGIRGDLLGYLPGHVRAPQVYARRWHLVLASFLGRESEADWRSSAGETKPAVQAAPSDEPLPEKAVVFTTGLRHKAPRTMWTWRQRSDAIVGGEREVTRFEFLAEDLD